MQPIHPHIATGQTAARLAAATAAVFALLLALVLGQGISQQYFELAHAPAIYNEALIAHGRALTGILLIDGAFILLYTATALFAIKTLSAHAPRFVAHLTGGLIIAVALLDMLENSHIYTLLQQVRNGNGATVADIAWQATESMMKWLLAYFAFFMLGFLVPGRNWPEKVLKYSLWFWFAPTGLLVFATAGTAFEQWLQWIRFANLLFGFVLIYLIMKRIDR
jgi:hypothetical protein